MLILRQITTPQYLLRLSSRHYAKKSTKMATSNFDQKQVHQETLRHINKYARINITSEIAVNIKSADVHEYPDADTFIAELHGSSLVKNCTATMKVDVSDDEKQVNVSLKKIGMDSDFHCQLDVPIHADLFIEAQNKVSVENMYNNVVQVSAIKDIKTKDLHANSITLSSQEGNIKCDGVLQGKKTQITTEHNGNVWLNKLLGDELICKTDSGSITTNSCYVESSKFETKNGALQLKNVHKKMEVCVAEKSSLNMTGVHGNLKVFARQSQVNLQLSEITGKSSIIIEDSADAAINISDQIEQNCHIEVAAKTVVELDCALKHLSSCLSSDKEKFVLARKTGKCENSLLICNNGGGVKLGKLSWADTVAGFGDRRK